MCLYCVVNLFFQGEEVKSQGVKGFILAQVRIFFDGVNVKGKQSVALIPFNVGSNRVATAQGKQGI